MNKEIEKLFVKHLQSVVMEFCRDFNEHNIVTFKLGMNNDIVLENLFLKKDILWKRHIPLHVVEGKIKFVHIKLPLNYKKPMLNIEVDTVDLTVIPISEADFNFREKQSQESYKEQKLRLWEEHMIKQYESLQPPSMIQKLIESVQENLTITVKSFSLIFKCQSIFGYETLLKLKFDELKVISTDEKWNPAYAQDQKISHKEITMKGFRVIIHASNNRQKFQPKTPETPIIYPVDLTVRVAVQKKDIKIHIPLNFLSIQFENTLVLMMNREQKNYIIKLNQLIKDLEIIQTNFHFRPEIPISKNWIEWWKYSIKAIVEKQRQYRLNLTFTSQRLILMKRYINIYKRKQNIISTPWLLQYTIQDDQKFKHCEQVLPLDDLIRFREIAFSELLKESKHFYAPKKNDTPKTLEDENVPMIVPNFRRESVDNDQIDLSLSVTLDHMVIMILEDRSNQHVYYSPENLNIYRKCECKLCQRAPMKARKIDAVVDQHIKQHQDISRRVGRLKTSTLRQVSEDVKHSQTSAVEQQDEDSFQSAEGDDAEFLDAEDTSRSEITQAIKTNSKQHFYRSTAQRLVLLIRATFISLNIDRYRDGRVSSGEAGGLIVENLQIISPGFLQDYVDREIDQIKYQWVLYLLDSLNFVLEQGQAPPNQPQPHFKLLLDFLVQNRMINLSEFLEKYNRNSHILHLLTEKTFKQFDMFFTPDSEYYLHLDKQRQNLYDQKKVNYEEFLRNQYVIVASQIRRHIYSFFLEEYGEHLIPQLMMNFKVITHRTEGWIPVLKVSFHAQSPIQVAVSQSQTPRSAVSNIILEQNQNENSLSVKLGLIKFFFTVRSIRALTHFIETETKPKQEHLFMNENSKLLECLMKSQRLDDVDPKIVKYPMKFELKMIENLKMYVLSEGLHNRTRSRLKILVEGFQVETLFNLNDFRQQLPNIDSFHQKHVNYYYHFILLNRLLVTHKFRKNEMLSSSRIQMNQSKTFTSSKQMFDGEVLILSLSLSVIVINALIPNHSALTDEKIYIHLPWVQFCLSDDLIGFFEFIHIFTEDTPSKKSQNTSALYTHSDSILTAELKTIYQEHKQSSANCRHCVIWYRKSCRTTNVIFGDVKHMLIDLGDSIDLTWFHVVDKWSNRSGSGVHFEFRFKSRIAAESENATVLHMPLMIITKDEGYFKDNLTIHCSQAQIGDTSLVALRNNNTSPSQRRGTNLTRLKSQKKTFLNIFPLVKKPFDIIKKLDDRHVYYCRTLEHEIFRDSDRHLTEDSKPDDLYLLAYIHKPVRSDLTQTCEDHQSNKDSKIMNRSLKRFKTLIFFRLREVSLTFTHPIQACVVPTLLQNISYTIKYLENAWNIIYGRHRIRQHSRRHSNESKHDAMDPMADPIAYMDKLIVLLSLDNLSYVIKEDDKLFFSLQARNIKLSHNLELMSHDHHHSHSHIHRSNISRQQEDIRVFFCQDIILQLKEAATLEITDVNLTRIQNQLKFKLARFDIKNDNQYIFMFPNNLQEQQPAIEMKLDVNHDRLNSEIILQEMQANIARENIQELFDCVNLIFILLVQEFRHHRRLLKKYVFEDDYTDKDTHFDLYKIIKPPSTESNINLKISVLLNLQKFILLLNKNNVLFTQLSMTNLKVMMHENGEIEANILRLGYFPHPNPQKQGKDKYSLSSPIEPVNLLQKSIENTDLKLSMRMNPSGKLLEVEVHNVKFWVVSMYLNELNSFIQGIQKELQKSRETILGEVKKPRRKQVFEELERMVKNQSSVVIHMWNSSIMLPQDSRSKNYIGLFFQRADIKLTKIKYNIDVPVIGVPERRGNLVVDNFQEKHRHIAHVQKLRMDLHGIDVIYELDEKENKLFRASEITVEAFTPLLRKLNYAHWGYKTAVEVSLKELNMHMDMGKLKKLQQLVDSNTKEKSDLFDYEPSSLDKINIKFKIEKVGVKQQKFVFRENVEQQFREENELSSDSDP